MRASCADRLSALLIIVVAWVSVLPPATASTIAPTLTVMPVIHDVVISPDGKMLAWADASSGKQHILMYEVATKKVLRDLALDDGMTFHSLEWSDEQTLLYTVSATEYLPRTDSRGKHVTIAREYYRMFSTGIGDTRQHMMLKSEADFRYVSGMVILRHHITKPNTIIVTTYTLGSAGWVWTVFSVDTHTGKSNRLEVGDRNTRQWLIDHDGQVIARSEWNSSEDTCTVLVKRSPGWLKLYETKCTSPLDIIGLDGGETAVLSIERDTDGRRKLWALPLDTSSRKVVAQDPTLDVQQVIVDDMSGVPTSARTLRSIIWLDPAAHERADILTRSFPKRRWEIASESADHQLVVLRVEGPSTAPSYFLVNLSTHQATPVGDEYPDLTDRKLADFSTVHYKAHDGTELIAYLTLPAQAGNSLLPLVVLPHGGPHMSDSGSEFEWLRQHLAMRGYAVLQPQFRGSSGFGAQFEHAGDLEWGMLMQDDLTDGVHAVIDQGRIDPHRICILGDSDSNGYAGYTALAGAAFTPDLYKCAISVNGISDLPGYLGYLIEQSANMSYWHRTLGMPGDPGVIERSPIRAANQMSASILLMYSADDTVVPPRQSEIMAESLKTAGKSVQLVEIPQTDQALSHHAARLRAMEEIDRFLDDHL